MIDSALLFQDLLAPPPAGARAEGHRDRAEDDRDVADRADRDRDAPTATPGPGRRAAAAATALALTLGILTAAVLGGGSAQAAPRRDDGPVSGFPVASTGTVAGRAPATCGPVHTLSAADQRLRYFYACRMDNLPLT